MKNISSYTENSVEKEKNMSSDYIDFSFIKGDISFSGDIQKIIKSEKKRCINEINNFLGGVVAVSRFITIMNLPLIMHDKKNNVVKVNCEISSRFIQDLMNENVIQNIHSNDSLDLINVDIDFAIGKKNFSEFDIDKEEFYNHMKEYVIEFIKQNHEVETAIVNNYCSQLSGALGYMKNKEKYLKQQQRIAQKIVGVFNEEDINKRYEVFMQNKDNEKIKKIEEKILRKFCGVGVLAQTKISIDKTKNNNEDIEKNIIVPIKRGEKNIAMDSKFFFLDNGSNLYDIVIQKSKYNQYYKDEISLIKESEDKIQPYIKKYYFGLGCGSGEKDYNIISKNIERDDKEENQKYQAVDRICFIDSSLKSLAKTENRIDQKRAKDKHIPIEFVRSVYGRTRKTKMVFSTDWVDKLSQKDAMRPILLTSVNGLYGEYVAGMYKTGKNEQCFTLLGGTFGNFGEYQKIFFQQMDQLMNEEDILCISLFNQPQSKEEEQKIVGMYDTPETHMFIKNFFMKIGIPKEAIEVQVIYKNNAINIDARINSKDNSPISIYTAGKEVVVPNGTVFHCISSQRMDEQDLQKTIDQSQASFNIVDKITTQNNPFTLYILEKK